MRSQSKAKKKKRFVLAGMTVLLLTIGGAGYGYLQSLDASEKVAMLPTALVNSVVAHADDKTDIIKKAQTSVYTIFTEDGMGSGFLYEEKGTVVTNAHVVAGFTDVTVRDNKGVENPGHVIGISDFFDVALIQVDAYEGQTPLPIGKDVMELGSEIIAMGSPQGLENSASIGYLTGLDRTFEDADYNNGKVYQIDAQIYPGSSGGPLLDAKNGEVIGINSGSLFEDETISYAIPITAMEVMLKKWSDSPMTEEEVAKIVPHEYDEYDFETGEDEEERIFEVPSLTNFVHNFRSSYAMAIEEDDYYYIEDMFDYENEAYEKIAETIRLLVESDTVFEMTLNEVTNVVIKDDHAIVSTYEVYDSIDAKGERTTFKKEKDYTIIFDDYGYYAVSEISDYY
ncbi:S1C family serine protease [Paenisporosarcina indica]|uniref:S1C family serine protease n=1 Tax=Paenisporosarcina indica TaxID=650093 RepID=UPI001FEB1D34|nr:S1C family serine protease [Paenisporosarcina indica]